jgi:hypothetical protein
MHGSSAVALSITYQLVIRKSKTARKPQCSLLPGKFQERDLTDIPAIGLFKQRSRKAEQHLQPLLQVP